MFILGCFARFSGINYCIIVDTFGSNIQLGLDLWCISAIILSGQYEVLHTPSSYTFPC